MALPSLRRARSAATFALGVRPIGSCIGEAPVVRLILQGCDAATRPSSATSAFTTTSSPGSGRGRPELRAGFRGREPPNNGQAALRPWMLRVFDEIPFALPP